LNVIAIADVEPPGPGHAICGGDLVGNLLRAIGADVGDGDIRAYDYWNWPKALSGRNHRFWRALQFFHLTSICAAAVPLLANQLCRSGGAATDRERFVRDPTTSECAT